MRQRVPLYAVFLGFLFCCQVADAGPAGQGRTETGGIYIDRNGDKHNWTVTGANALLWNLKPYVPMGGVFVPKSLALESTEANWALDKASLSTLVQHGVHDILIQPEVSLAEVSTPALQRLLDQLEADGFRYGLGFGQGITTPLTGTVVRPSVYRKSGLEVNQDVTWEVPDADSGRYVFVSELDATRIEAAGQVNARGGVLEIPGVRRSSGSSVALLYPRRVLKSRAGSTPDVWASLDRYRDQLLSKLATVKFGPGLRFLLDPLGKSISLGADTEYLIPDSTVFRMEWEAYLARKHTDISKLNQAWGLLQKEAKDYRQAAAFIPLWSSGRGVAYLLDSNTNELWQVSEASKFWADFTDYRNEALNQAVNSFADVLKREVANVPVIYTHTRQHRMFENNNRVGGFDGLGLAAYGKGSSLVTGGVDSGYGQLRESTRSLWCIASEIGDKADATRTETGFSTRQAMHYDLDWLRGIGIKGFFVNGFQTLGVATAGAHELLKSPEQLDWVKEYGDRLTRETTLADSHPRTLPYPVQAAGMITPGAIGNSGVWWVPSLAPGKPLSFGSTFSGYNITLPEGEAMVIWSHREIRPTRFSVADPRKVVALSVAGEPLKPKLDVKKHLLTIPVGEEPVVLRTGGQQIFPVDAIEDLFNEAKVLIDKMAERKLPVDDIQFRLKRGIQNMQRGDLSLALAVANQVLLQAIDEVQPYTWLEFETASQHTFSEVKPTESASGGSLLSLNTGSRPGREGYSAQIKFDAPTDDQYSIWVSASPPGARSSSFAWIMDTQDANSSEAAQVVGKPYLGDQLIWYNLGKVALKKGQHILTLRVLERASSTSAFALDLDAAIITRYGFTPNGVLRPQIDASYFVKPAATGKK